MLTFVSAVFLGDARSVALTDSNESWSTDTLNSVRRWAVDSSTGWVGASSFASFSWRRESDNFILSTFDDLV
jgi:hypothetical protein